MTIKSGYKQTVLGWLPEEWEVKEFGEVCRVNQGLQIPIEERLTAPTKKSKVYITIQYLNDGKGVEYIEDYLSSVCCEEDDVLMTRTGNTGIVVSGVTGVFHNNFFKINFDRTILDKEFLIEYLRSFKTQHTILLKAGASTIPDLNHKDFYRINVPLPKIGEQRRIAAILSTWDKAIAKEQQLIEALQTRHRALMQQLLSGKKRLKGFKDKWIEVKMSDIFDRITRKNTEGDNTVVTISAQRGFVIQTDFFNKNIASDITDNYFLVKCGEFCYNKSYSNGYPWGAIKRLTQFEKAVVTTLYICFGIKNEKQNSASFFEHFFEGGLLNNGLMKIAHEGGRAHGLLNVTPNDFFGLKINIPIIEEQTAIAAILCKSEQQIKTHRRRLAALQQQKKGLMQVLLTGKIRVKIPAI